MYVPLVYLVSNTPVYFVKTSKGTVWQV